MKTIYKWLACALVCSAFSAQAQNTGTVKIMASKEVVRNRVVIHYRVINESGSPISAFNVGADGNNPDEAYLTVPPVGFSFGVEEHEADVLPTTSASSPAGWQVEPIRGEGSAKLSIRWKIAANDETATIKPGTSLGGFSVILPKNDGSYTKSRAAVYFSRGDEISTTVQMQEEIIDLPPKIAVHFHPDELWPANDKMIEVKAHIDIKDETKVAKVTLDSIQCNSPCDAKKDVTGAAIGTDDRTFSLRALKPLKGVPIEYSVTYSVTDPKGQRASQVSKLKVEPPQHKPRSCNHK